MTDSASFSVKTPDDTMCRIALLFKSITCNKLSSKKVECKIKLMPAAEAVVETRMPFRWNELNASAARRKFNIMNRD